LTAEPQVGINEQNCQVIDLGVSSVLPSVLRRIGTPSKPTSNALTGEVKSRFQRLQLDGVQKHVIRAAVINSVLAALLVPFLTPTFGWTPTHVWLGVKLAISVVRVLAALAYSRSSWPMVRDGFSRQLTLVLLALDGAIWGAAGAWCAFGPSEFACLTCAVLCSVALMATHGFNTMAAASVAYVTSMLVPLAVAVALRGDALGVFVSLGTILVLLQSIVTAYASERRLRSEFLAHEATEEARLRETRNAEALAAALLEVKRQGAVKSLFLGTMSHELRTPLHGILGLTQLIRKQTAADPVVQHRLALLESSGTHLLELIGSLLDISRIESGRLELRHATFDLALELANVADLYKLRCDSKGLDFSSSIRIDTPCRVIGDPARVRQVLHNLLGNAVKFTKSGLVVLKVQRQGKLFSFEIRDTGPGIATKDAAHIFDAFRQADDSATRPADGTGLGLTIAREIAQAMGGDVGVSSAVGVGSQFTFTAILPEAPATSDQSAQPQPKLPHVREGYRVLLVEDNEVNALIATANLANIGAEVVRANNGKEAISAAFAKPRPDFVFMDCRMPVMDGPTASREIRAIETRIGLPSVPIVALTASPSDEDRRECYEAGMDGLLMKPFTLEQLLQTIALYAADGVCNRNHPLYEYAKSLDDSEPDSSYGQAVH
jgi:signal transduction histidine kinase/DNA-binding NarL/FixJ family response regulator